MSNDPTAPNAGIAAKLREKCLAAGSRIVDAQDNLPAGNYLHHKRMADIIEGCMESFVAELAGPLPTAPAPPTVLAIEAAILNLPVDFLHRDRSAQLYSRVGAYNQGHSAARHAAIAAIRPLVTALAAERDRLDKEVDQFEARLDRDDSAARVLWEGLGGDPKYRASCWEISDMLPEMVPKVLAERDRLAEENGRLRDAAQAVVEACTNGPPTQLIVRITAALELCKRALDADAVPLVGRVSNGSIRATGTERPTGRTS